MKSSSFSMENSRKPANASTLASGWSSRRYSPAAVHIRLFVVKSTLLARIPNGVSLESDNLNVHQVGEDAEPLVTRLAYPHEPRCRGCPVCRRSSRRRAQSDRQHPHRPQGRRASRTGAIVNVQPDGVVYSTGLAPGTITSAALAAPAIPKRLNRPADIIHLRQFHRSLSFIHPPWTMRAMSLSPPACTRSATCRLAPAVVIGTSGGMVTPKYFAS